MSAAPSPTPARRPPTKRRAATRQRLLDTAATVFSERGFGRTTIEQLCDAAGFTRGAFYSNFASLDEVFLAMWEQQSERMLTGLREATLDLDPPRDSDALTGLLDEVLAHVPVDEAWYRLTAEFTAHALRTPALREVVRAREAAIAETLLAILRPALAPLGRSVTDPEALTQALVAVHDGTTLQCLLDPDNAQVRAHRRALFRTVLLAYSTPDQPEENR